MGYVPLNADPKKVAKYATYREGITVEALREAGLLLQAPANPHPCNVCYLNTGLYTNAIAIKTDGFANALLADDAIIHDETRDREVVVTGAKSLEHNYLKILYGADYLERDDLALLVVIPVHFRREGLDVASRHARLLLCNMSRENKALVVKVTLYDPHGTHFLHVPVMDSTDVLIRQALPIVFGGLPVATTYVNRTFFAVCPRGLQIHEHAMKGKHTPVRGQPTGHCSVFAALMAALVMMLPGMSPAQIEADISIYCMRRALAAHKRAHLDRQVLLDLAGTAPGVGTAPGGPPGIVDMRTWGNLWRATAPTLKDLAPGSPFLTEEDVGDNTLYELLTEFSQAVVDWNEKNEVMRNRQTFKGKCCCDANVRGLQHNVDRTVEEHNKRCEEDYDKAHAVKGGPPAAETV